MQVPPDRGVLGNLWQGVKHAYQANAPAMLGGDPNKGAFTEPGHGISGFVGETAGGLVGGTLNPEQLPANVLGYLTGAKATQAAAPIIEKVGAVAGPKIAQVLSHMIGGAGGTAPIGALQRAGQITTEQWQADPLGSLAEVGKAAGTAGALGAGIGAVTGAVGRAPEVPIDPNAPVPLAKTPAPPVPRPPAPAGDVPIPDATYDVAPPQTPQPTPQTPPAAIPDTYKVQGGAGDQVQQANPQPIPLAPKPASRISVNGRTYQLVEDPLPAEKPTVPLQDNFDPTQQADRGPWQETQGYRMQGQDVPRLPPPGQWHDVSGKVATTPSPGIMPPGSDALTRGPSEVEQVRNVAGATVPSERGAGPAINVQGGATVPESSATASPDTSRIDSQSIIKPNDASAVPLNNPQRMTMAQLRAELESGPNEIVNLNQAPKSTLIKAVNEQRRMLAAPKEIPNAVQEPQAKEVRDGQGTEVRQEPIQQVPQGPTGARVQPGERSGGGEQLLQEGTGKPVDVLKRPESPPLRGMGAADPSMEGGQTQARVTQAAEHRGIVDQAPSTLRYRFQKLGDEAKEFWRYFSNKSAPTITAIDRNAGEATARYQAIPESVQWRQKAMAAKVFGSESPNQIRKSEPYKTAGAVAVEDNLRGIAKQYRNEAAQADRDGDSKLAQSLLTKADGVGSLVGPGGKWEDEGAYQKDAARADVRAVADKFGQHMNPWMDTMRKAAKGIAQDEELPSRGDQYGVRVNLIAADPADSTPGVQQTAGVRRGDLGAARYKGAAFDQRATGSAKAYNTDLLDMMTNTISKATKPARYREMMDAMVQAPSDSRGKLAFYADRKGDGVIDGQKYVAEDIRGNPKDAPGKYIYVREDAYPEFRRSLQADAPIRAGVVSYVADAANKIGISGTAEAFRHSANIGAWFYNTQFRGGSLLGKAGEVLDRFPLLNGATSPLVRAAALVGKIPAAVSKNPEILDRIAALADEGAMPREHGGSKYNPLAYSGKMLDVFQKAARLAADASFDEGVKRGEFVDTPTNRRGMANAMGQYIRGSQGQIIRILKDSGVSPFVTAFKSSAVMAKNLVTLDPGVEATSNTKALQLRAEKLARIASPFALVAAYNYLTTGKWMGRPGVPVGAADSGKNDEDGNPVYNDGLLKYTGLRKAMKMMGADAALTETKRGLNTGSSTEDILANAGTAGARQVGNSLIGGVTGPLVRDISELATGGKPFFGAPQDAAPRQNPLARVGERVKAMAMTANPISDAFRTYQKDGNLTGALSQAILGENPQRPFSERREVDHQKIMDAVSKGEIVDYIASQLRRLPRGTRLAAMERMLSESDIKDTEKALARRTLLKTKMVMKD